MSGLITWILERNYFYNSVCYGIHYEIIAGLSPVIVRILRQDKGKFIRADSENGRGFNFAHDFRLTQPLADFTLPMNVKGELHNDPK